MGGFQHPVGMRPRPPVSMGGADTTFSPGRADTVATLGPGGRGSGIQALIEELLRRKLDPKKPAALGAKAGRVGRRPGADPREGYMRAQDHRAREAAVRAAEAQADLAQASTRPMPKKHVTIGGFSGALPDTEQLPVGLLPGNAQMDTASLRGGGDEDFERFGRMSVARKKIQNAGYAY